MKLSETLTGCYVFVVPQEVTRMLTSSLHIFTDALVTGGVALGFTLWPLIFIFCIIFYISLLTPIPLANQILKDAIFPKHVLLASGKYIRLAAKWTLSSRAFEGYSSYTMICSQIRICRWALNCFLQKKKLSPNALEAQLSLWCEFLTSGLTIF